MKSAANGSLKPDTIIETENGKKTPASKIKGLAFPTPEPTLVEETWYVYLPGEERQGPFTLEELNDVSITFAAKMRADTATSAKAGHSFRDVIITKISTGQTDKAHKFKEIYPDGLSTEDAFQQEQKTGCRILCGCLAFLFATLVLQRNELALP